MCALRHRVCPSLLMLRVGGYWVAAVEWWGFVFYGSKASLI